MKIEQEQNPSARNQGRRFMSMLLLAVGLIAASSSTVFSQTTIGGENTDLWAIRGNALHGIPGNNVVGANSTGTWHADSLWVGATFLRDSTKRFVVWLANYYVPQGSYHGALYLMIRRPGLPDSALFLFYNKCNNTYNPPIPTSIDLTNNPLITQSIHDLDTLFFMYRSFESNSGGNACGNYTVLTTDNTGGQTVRQNDSLFTGPNRAPGDVPAWLNLDRHYSARNGNTLVNPQLPQSFFSINQNRTVPVGRRWCEAGWVHRDTMPLPASNIRTDTVEFGFEDQFNGGDIHFEDIRFNVTGVFIVRAPSKITLSVFPKKDTIQAGDTVHIGAHIYDAFNVDHPELNVQVQWTLTPSGTASYLRTANPDSTNTFHAVDAYQFYVIKAFYVDPNNPRIIINDSVRVYVKPGLPTHLNIEPVSDSTVSLLNDNYFPQHALAIQGTTLKDSVYAVLRDAFGNWVSHATLAAWLSRDVTIVTAASTTRTQLGEGVITRATAATASTIVRASQLVGAIAMADSIQVNVSNVLYSQVQIYVISGGKKLIDTVSMRTDQDTTLHAEGLRADGSGIWDDIAVTWGNSAGLTFNNTAPASGQSWTFNPQAPGTGSIFIQFTSGAAVLRDTVGAVFIPGLPNREALYPLTGPPNATTNQPLAPTATVVAGTPFQIVAKLFDNKNFWLSSYERPNAPIAWTLQEVSGNPPTGTLSASSGYLTTFTGTKAGNIVKITATYQQEPGNSNAVPSQSIVISVIAGPPTHLVIEGDSLQSRSPNSDNPVGTVTIGARDTSQLVYAILRDAYGNWVDFSRATLWNSADATKAIAVGGNTNIGQGIIIRRTASGNTIVIARDSIHTGAGFTDTVAVVLSNISYDSLRIVVGAANTIIQSLVMRTDVGDTTLNVQGKRSDNGQWVPVSANWAITPALKTSFPAPSLSTSWRFTPVDTGSGIIFVSLAGSVGDTVHFHFLPGLAYSLVLYQGPGAPGGTNAPLIPPATAIVDTAGKPLQMYAKIFDKNGIWLGSYERASSPVSWSIVELAGNPPTGALSAAAGYTSAFTPTRAYNTLYVIARFDSLVTARDTVQISVVHAAASQLVIEADPNWQVKPNAAVPVDSIRIAKTQTWVSVYALLRDRFGNFVQYSTNTDWESLNPATLLPGDTSVVSVHNGTNTIGEGIVYRIAAEGRQPVTAASKDYPGLADTITAIVLKYDYLRLLVVANVKDTVHLGSLTMNTNQDTTLLVVGQRSDDSTWEPVTNAKWEISAGLLVPVNQAPPGSAGSWTFSPSAPGTGIIRVTQGNATPDTVHATFTVGPPTNIQVQIITPPDKLIAGDTIVSIVKITNKDGLVPGQYCATAEYQNALGGLPGHNPVVITNDTSSTMGQSIKECFNNGVDTVKYILYKAPFGTDSLEKIAVSMGVLNAVTDPFLLHPGDLSRIAIEDFAGKSLDSVTLIYPTDSKLMIAMGYDKFGNKIGPLQDATWATDGTLHSIDRPVGSRIFYQSAQVVHDESGNITATALNLKETKITGIVHVTIEGPPNTIVSAVTRDANGNGFLDRIDVQLYSPATLPVKGSQITFTGTYNDPVTAEKVTYSTYLTVDSVVSKNGTGTDSLFSVYLDEPKPGTPGYNFPQTGWTPTITIGGVGPSAISRTTIDGAGPVVWTVIKTINNPADRTKDVVTVTFSEPIAGGVNSFSLSNTPQSVLQVWADSTVAADSILAGITVFYQLSNNNTTLSFYMSNSSDLTSRDYINIVGNSTKLTDNSSSANSPAANNRRVQVIVKGLPAQAIKVVPNPTGPVFTHEPPGTMNLAYQPQARDWVRADGAGALLTFDIAPTIDPVTHRPEIVTGYLKIYDVIGNVVVDAKSSDAGILPTTWTDSSHHNFDMYWNGSNSKKMRVAPGIYRAVLYLTYPEFNKPKKYVGTIGIAK